MANIIQRPLCIETPSGYLLTWDIAEGASPIYATVYGMNKARVFKIDQPLIKCGRCLIPPDNYSLMTSFKISVKLPNGEVEETEPLSAQKLKRSDKLIIDDIRRRFITVMKASPIASYKCTVLFRRIEGTPCPRCGNTVCSGRGGERLLQTTVYAV